MQKFKQLNSSTIIMAGRLFRGYTVGDLPKTFAFIYNAAGVPIAAGILYPAFGLQLSPMIADAELR